MRLSTEKMNLTDSKFLRIGTLCSLYVAQGIPFGFVMFTLVAYLSGRGFEETDIGNITVWSTLPWAFKWAWGPIVDRFGIPSMGHRRPWIISAQCLMVITIAAMLFIPDLTSNIKMLCAMIFIHNVFCALQDVSVDALAVDLLKEDERGKVNGYMFASKTFGTMIGGAGLIMVEGRFGMRAVLMVQSAMLLGFMLIPILLRERAGEKLLPWTKGTASSAGLSMNFTSTKQLLNSLLKAFSLRSTILTAILALFVNFSIGILSVAGSVLFIQLLGWKGDQFVRLNGFWGMFVAAFASISGGFIADKLGCKKIIAIGAAMLATLWITLSLTSSLWPCKPYLFTITMLETYSLYIMTVAFFSLAMGVSWPKVAATQFTAYMALLNLSTVFGAKASAIFKGVMLSIFPYTPNPDFVAVPGQIGYDPAISSNPFGVPNAIMSYVGLFFCAGILQLLVLVILPFIDPGQSKRVLSDL